MTNAVPIIDLDPWWNGDDAERAAVARSVDVALQRSGFLLITGHGVPPHEPKAVREAARTFFCLPDEVKRQYAAAPNERGWLPPGAEANGYSEGTPTPPDLKESLSFGAETATGDPAVDARWYQPNPWPRETPGLATPFRFYTVRMRSLAFHLMGLCAAALDLPEGWFRSALHNPTWTFNVNHYPPLSAVAAPQPGQFRIGPHTDFGTLTLLDREAGAGGLQVCTVDGEWVDAPYEPGALTVNVGDLLARWTGDRWLSARHRVLPPQPEAPDEDLLSLVFFYECDPSTVIESMPAPIGRTSYPPVSAADYLDQQYRAISLG